MSAYSESRTTTGTAPASSRSRMTICCGRIRRPLGAALSIGTTRITGSPGFTRSRTRGFSAEEVFASFPSASFNSHIPSPVSALTGRTESGIRSAFCSDACSRSVLFRAIRKGISFCLNSSISSRSASCIPVTADTTRTARSVWFRILLVRRTRSSPSSPASSIPGVSMITTGPIGSSSMVFFTGSVVGPFTSETMESSWPVTALTTLDFPAFLTPKNAM